MKRTIPPEAQAVNTDLAYKIANSSRAVPVRFALFAHFFAMGRLLDSVYQSGQYVITHEPSCIYSYSLIVFSRLIGDVCNLRKIYNTKEGLLWLELLLAREFAAASTSSQCNHSLKEGTEQ